MFYFYSIYIIRASRVELDAAHGHSVVEVDIQRDLAPEAVVAVYHRLPFKIGLLLHIFDLQRAC